MLEANQDIIVDSTRRKKVMSIQAILEGEPILERLDPLLFVLIQILIIILILIVRAIAKTAYKFANSMFGFSDNNSIEEFNMRTTKESEGER